MKSIRCQEKKGSQAGYSAASHK